MDKRVFSGKNTRRQHSEALRRDLIERSLQPGASVSALAQAWHQPNLLFNWRRLHLRAQREVGAMVNGSTLLLVTVVPDVPTAQTTSPRLWPASPRAPRRRH